MKDLKKVTKVIAAVACCFAVIGAGSIYLSAYDTVNAAELENNQNEIETQTVIEVVEIEENTTEIVTIEDEETPEAATIEFDPYANVPGNYVEDITDEATGIRYNMWVPESGTENKPVIFCITGISNWESEKCGFGPHQVLSKGQITPDAVIVIIQRRVSGTITNSYSLDKVSAFIKKSIIEEKKTSTENVYYYGFSMGGVDFNLFGGLYDWKAAAFTDGYNSAMNAATYCKSLKAVMYNNSTGTASAWNKNNADQSAKKLGLTEGVDYVWNMLNGSHGNINQYAVVAEEGQGASNYSSRCTWKQKESEELPQALNWLLQW